MASSLGRDKPSSLLVVHSSVFSTASLFGRGKPSSLLSVVIHAPTFSASEYKIISSAGEKKLESWEENAIISSTNTPNHAPPTNKGNFFTILLG
jgi:hypothetical protein